MERLFFEILILIDDHVPAVLAEAQAAHDLAFGRCDVFFFGAVVCLHIVVIELNMLHGSAVFKAAEAEGKIHIFFERTVYRKENDLSLFGIVYDGACEVGNFAAVIGGVFLGTDDRVHGFAAAIGRSIHERPEDRLNPGFAAFFRHDRCDDVDELCKAGHLDAVAVVL